MKWWFEAAKEDHSLAQFNIARAYYLGIGLKEDHERSKYWFSRAADNKEPKSIEILAKLGWADDDIDTTAAPDFEGKPNSYTAVMKAIELDGKTDGKTDRQAFTQDTRNTNPASQLAIKEARNRRATPNLKSRITPFDPSAKTSAAPKPNASNLKTDEQPLARTPLDVAVASKPGNDLAKVRQVEKTIPIDSMTPAADSRKPVAIYTDPRIRSVLIAIIDDRTDLTVTKAGSQWSSVKSNTGIPVWMHGDYLKLDRPLANNGSVMGRVTADSVNTRSVPIVSSGTLVGRLNKGERLRVIEKRRKWYRVIGPTRFTAWVKARDFSTPTAKARSALKREQAASKPNSRYSDNEWLFQQKATDYTLQLGSFVGDTQTGYFLSSIDFRESSNLHQLGSNIDDIQRTVFVYGAYKNRRLATDKKVQIDQKQAWVRTVGGLQNNRCQQWREQRPTPEELRRYCKQ